MCYTFKFLNPHLSQVGLCRRTILLDHPRLAVDNGGKDASATRQRKPRKSMFAFILICPLNLIAYQS
jgi:hypothetical protein